MENKQKDTANVALTRNTVPTGRRVIGGSITQTITNPPKRRKARQ